MIAIVDYGLGNIQAFLNVFKRLNLQARAAQKPAELHGATRLILPGVGAFDHAMQQLQASGMRDALDRLVQVDKVPLLGVCVGMQMLAQSSDEGRLPGLGWVPGHVRSFASAPAAHGLPQPHMGWNDVQAVPGEALFAGLENNARFYFLHSYYFDCGPAQQHSTARAHYGMDFSCVVRAAHVAGVQFHPEKSHHWGTQLLKNFGAH